MPWYEYGLLFLAAGVAGAVNAVAGGGTLLTFPALLWAHQTAIVANATSTVALWPGQLSSLWGYRKQLAGSAKGAALLAVPSLLGGLFGAILFVKTDNATFAALVPYLILLATLLFVLQEPLARWSERRATPETLSPPMPPTQTLSPHHCDSLGPAAAFPVRRWLAVMAFQFFVATYGGYFGAGIGILMLAAFGFLGLRNIHQMNGLKNVNGLAINAVAATPVSYTHLTLPTIYSV